MSKERTPARVQHRPLTASHVEILASVSRRGRLPWGVSSWCRPVRTLRDRGLIEPSPGGWLRFDVTEAGRWVLAGVRAARKAGGA